VADAATRRNLALRLLTAAVGAPIVLYLLFAGPFWGFPALTAATCALAAIELYAMVAPGQRLLATYGTLACLVIFAFVAIPAARPFSVAGLLVLTVVGLLVPLAHPEPVEHASARMAWALAGPLYLGGLFGALADIFRYPSGGSWVLLALVCAFFSDTAGYFVGRKYGTRPLHAVSPKKTVEGSVGGLLGALGGGLAVRAVFLPEVTLLRTITLCLLAAALGQAGDLCESLIKRSVGVKDSGTLLPGHGGMLDRTDAMLFSAATVWVYLTLFA